MRFVKNCFLFVVVFVACLLLAEIAGRFLFPHWAPNAPSSPLWEYHPQLGWAHKPGAKVIFKGYDYSVPVSINSDGLRDREYSFQKDRSKQRMLILGDSFGWGYGVEQSKMFSEILERRHPDWEIINASVSGYSTDQELLYFKNKGYQYEPDVVLLLFVHNDIDNNCSSAGEGYYKPRFRLIDGQLIYPSSNISKQSIKMKLVAYLNKNTYLIHRIYKWIWHLRTRILTGVSATWKKRQKREIDGVVRENQGCLELSESLLTELKDLISESEAKFIVTSFSYHGFRFEKTFSHLISSEGVTYHSLTESISENADRLNFKHDYHWNEDGHQAVADSIDHYIEELGVW